MFATLSWFCRIIMCRKPFFKIRDSKWHKILHDLFSNTVRNNVCDEKIRSCAVKMARLCKEAFAQSLLEFHFPCPSRTHRQNHQEKCKWTFGFYRCLSCLYGNDRTLFHNVAPTGRSISGCLQNLVQFHGISQQRSQKGLRVLLKRGPFSLRSQSY